MKQRSLIVLLLAIASTPFDAIVDLRVVRISATEVLFSIAFFVAVIDVYRSRKEIIGSPFFTAILTFMGACFLSFVNSGNSIITLREILQYGWLFSIFYFVMVSAKGRDLYTPIYFVLTSVALIVSIVGIFQYFFVKEPVSDLIAGVRLRAHGCYDQPNPFGSFLIGVMPLVVGAYLLQSSIAGTESGRFSQFLSLLKRKPAILVLHGFLSASLIMSFSRGSWVGIVCGLALIAYHARKMHLLKRLLIPIMVTILIGVGVYVDVSVQPTKVDREYSNNQRMLLLETSIKMLKDYPILGIGLGNFQFRLAEYAPEEFRKTLRWVENPTAGQPVPKMELVHNMFLQIAVESGIVGLAAFLFFLVQYYRTALRRLNSETSTEKRIRRCTLLAGVTAILAGGLFGWPFSHGVQEILVVLMALAVA